MSGLFHFSLVAEARAGLLCKIVGLFAQCGLPPPTMQVEVKGGDMVIEASTPPFEERLARILAAKMAEYHGVYSAELQMRVLEDA